MNWRDYKTNLVHTVDYDNDDAWGAQIRDREIRRMVCGVEVRVQDGVIGGKDSLIAIPWAHTRDEPTCFSCIAGRGADAQDGVEELC